MIYTFKPLQDLHGYANPWPAGGGVNKWDEEWELGTISNEGAPTPSTTQIRSENAIPVSAKTKYYIVTPAAMTVHYYEVDDTYITNESVTSSKEITTPADCAYMLFSMASTYGTEYKHDISFNYPSSVTTYRSYENICPLIGVDVPGIGTVYAGSIDTNSRELIITHKPIALKNLTWNVSNTHCFYTQVVTNAKSPPNNTTPPNIYCSDYRVGTSSQTFGGTIGSCISIGVAGVIGAGRVLVWNSNYDDASDFTPTLTNAVLLYELATAETVTLTENQLAVLLGNLGAARNFGSRTNMLNTWMKLAQGHPVSDDELHMLRPSMTIPDDVVLRPTFEDTPLPVPDPVPDVVDTPAAEPEENITESEES